MDLIIINGNINTLDKFNSGARAVAVENGKIAKVGSNDEILALRENSTQVIDLKGKLLVPGFNDSHMHLIDYGASMQKVNLVGSKSIEDIIERTRLFILQNRIPKGTWIQGRGWNHDFFNDKSFPSRYDLDKISNEHPICLSRACGHVCTVNSKALEKMKISKYTPQVAGGHFDIDDTGEPLGIFRENALNMIYNLIPEPYIDAIKDMILNVSKLALKQGITSIQTDDFGAVPGKNYNKVIEAYTEMDKLSTLPVRINQQCLLPNINSLNEFLNAGYMTGNGSNFYKIGPLKLLADGSLGARTAYLSKPYSDSPESCGIPVYRQDELDELVITAHRRGMQVAIHCIGDKAMYMAFQSFEMALREYPRVNHRHSIIHCQITDNTLLDKFKSLNIVAHIQPIFIDYDLHIVENRIGSERAKASYNWKGMYDRGVKVACGSDCPVEPFNVLNGIYCAVTRKDLIGYPKDGWLPEQKLTVEQALSGFTYGSAYASFEEGMKGSITPGKLADMTVLSDDIFNINPEDIKNVEVLMTFVDGKLVYQR